MVSWVNYLYIFSLVGLLSTILWPAIWCKDKVFPAIAGFHVVTEFWGVLKILFGGLQHDNNYTNKIIDGTILILMIAYEIACILLPAETSLVLFYTSFSITDTSSLFLGLYLLCSNTNADAQKWFEIGFYFFTHGFITIVVGAMLGLGQVLELDKLFNFIFIFLNALVQLYISRNWLLKRYVADNDHSQEIVLSSLRRCTLCIICTMLASGIVTLVNITIQTSVLPCNTHKETIIAGAVLFPLIGITGLFILIQFFFLSRIVTVQV